MGGELKMNIASTKNYHIAECGNCGALFLFNGEIKDSLNTLFEQYRQHLNRNPKCKTWHNKLPILKDLKGIL
jgi:hypothetical protein